MSEDGIFLLKIYVLLSPFFLLLTVLATIKAADWLERCEARRHPAE
jgi:hypothetical protein